VSPEKSKSPLDINLFRDYRNVKPVSSSEEDIKDTPRMSLDGGDDDDVFKKNDKVDEMCRPQKI